MKRQLFFFATLFIGFLSSAQTTMTFSADIVNRNGDVLFIKKGKTIVQEIKADDKGKFKSTFEISEGLYELYDGVEYAQLYLKNGFDLSLTMDAQHFDESLKFTGKGEKENNFLANETREDSKFNYEELLSKDEADFKVAFEKMKEDDLSRLSKAGLDETFVSNYKNNLTMKNMGLFQYHTQIVGNKKLNNSVAPNFDYENAKGGTTSLESLKGKYVYIDVWATWCGPCRAEIPFLKKVEEKFHGKNIEFVSISVDVEKDHDKWKNFVKEKELGGIQLFADKNWNSSFITAFGIMSIPRFILIDPKGNVIDADAARPSNPKLEEQLNSLLKS